MAGKRILIVGGGVAGMSCAIYARLAGYEAAVYEKCAVMGGELTGWDRNGYHIDNCVHWLMGSTGESDLHGIWETVGVVGPNIEVLRADSMYRSELDGQSLTLWRDIERTRREMLALSPEDRDAIEELIADCKLSEKVAIPAGKAPELMNPIELIRMGLSAAPALKLFKKYAGTDTRDLMARFKHPLIRCAISDFCTRDSLGQSFPMAYGNFTGGDGGLPRGGSREMARRMEARLLALGGEIHKNAEAVAVRLENGRALGVELADESFARGDYLVLSCDTSYTFSHLLDKKYMDPVLREMYDRPKDYPVYGMFQAAFAVDSPEDAPGGDVILPSGELRFCDWVSDRMTVKTYAYEPSFAPPGKQILQVLLGLETEGWEYWRDLYRDKKAYDAKKAELTETMKRILEARFPAYAGKLTTLDSWTPVTYNCYMNAYRGYNQAFTPTKRSRKNPYPSARIVGIENCLLAGQWINPPGGLPGAAITGKYAVQRIEALEKKKK